MSLSLFMSVSLSAQCTVCCVLLYMFASFKKLLSKDSCASLVPLGMKWACMCAEKECAWCGVMCLCCVFVPVAMWCSVLSLLSSLCCWLRQRRRRCVGYCVVRMRVLKKTISVIVHKLHRKEFISITVLSISKKNPASNYEHYGFDYFEKICNPIFCNHFLGDGGFESKCEHLWKTSERDDVGVFSQKQDLPKRR